MPVTQEQLEAWAAEAADGLSRKIGANAQVIVMVLNLEDKAPYMIERRGHALGLNWLLQVGRRIVEDATIPGPTLNRKDTPTI